MNAHTSSLGTIMGLLALCILLGANLTQLVSAHGAIQQAIDRQKASDATIAKIDAQLDALASSTQRLSASGNANASRIIASLAENGIRIKPQH